MNTIKVTCLLCKQEFAVGVEQICWSCSSHSFLLKVEKEDPAKKFWKNAKEFALWAVLYLPIPSFLFFYYGFKEQLLWILGGIFIQTLTTFHRWLLSKI